MPSSSDYLDIITNLKSNTVFFNKMPIHKGYSYTSFSIEQMSLVSLPPLKFVHLPCYYRLYECRTYVLSPSTRGWCSDRWQVVRH